MKIKVANLLIKFLLLTAALYNASAVAQDNVRVPILVYHSIAPVAKDSMTLSLKKFEDQLKWLRDNNYTVIPLRDLVAYLQGKLSTIPDKSVVITADDGRSTVYTYMWPMARKYNVPVTLFIYPTAISNASYAMTWDQLRELQQTGLFDIQGHTYWHPNFKQEKKRLSAAEYKKLVYAQFVSSKKIIDEKLKTNISLLAWPFGIYDEQLEQEAKDAGYEMAFSIDARHAKKSEHSMAQPRYMILEGQSMSTFISLVTGNR